MGVPQLFQKLKHKGNQRDHQWDINVDLKEDIDISVKNYLVVDSSSFFFFALKSDSLKERFLAAIGIERVISSCFNKAFDFLMKDLNFQLIFVEDGYEDAFIDPNVDEEKRISTEVCLYNLSRAFESESCDDSFLTNPKAGKIFNRILKSRGIETIQSEYEADLTCTIKCNELNRELLKTGDPRRAFCLSTDSDFILMPEALTLHPGDFPKTIEPDSKLLTINVYSREKAYRKFRLRSEEELVKACIYLGNDFTGHLSFTCPILVMVFDKIRNGTWKYKPIRRDQKDAYKYSMAFYHHQVRDFEKLFRANCKPPSQAYKDFFMPENYELTLEKRYGALSDEEFSENDFIQYAIEVFLAERTIEKTIAVKQKWNVSTKKYDPITQKLEFNLSDNLLDAIKSLLESPPILSETHKEFTEDHLKKITLSDHFFLIRLQYGLNEIYNDLYQFKKPDCDLWAVFNLEALYRRYLGLDL